MRSGVLGIMRQRNWVMSVAAPVLAAVIVGVAVVVATGGGGNGGAAPSALAAGFAPARLAGASFTGKAGSARVSLTAIGASGPTEVAVGGLDNGPALWTSRNGGAGFTRAVLNGNVGRGQFVGVVDGQAGWLAVGNARATGGPQSSVVASSPDARTWTIGIGLGKSTPTAVAAGPSGYVIVGFQSVNGSTAAAAWSSSGLTGFHRATVTATETGAGAQMMNAVTGTAHGFVAVGASGTNPAAWLSPTGKTWQQVLVPAPPDAARSALQFVAANGSMVVAAGTEFSATGVGSPFVEASANGGTTWTPIDLPVPGASATTTGTTATANTTVTALTAAGGGFTAAGTYMTQNGRAVVIWTLPSGAAVTDGGAWSEVTPQGTGLAGAKTANTLTGLNVDGASLIGVGSTAPLSGPGAQGTPLPTLWQSTIRP